jgi:two-component system, cell cycle response regulator DivK
MTQMASEKILIVDDSPFNRKLLRLLLKKNGYELREAEDAGRAIQILEAWRPELILMDVRLPGIDGLELTRLLKASGDTRDIAVVAISASWTKDSEDKARQAGCEACVEKRFDAVGLPKLVAGILARHRQS